MAWSRKSGTARSVGKTWIVGFQLSEDGDHSGQRSLAGVVVDVATNWASLPTGVDRQRSGCDSSTGTRVGEVE